MISVILPSRGRPREFTRMVDSMRATQSNTNQVVVYIDDDDSTLDDYPKAPDIEYIVGPRIILTDCWNKCLPQAKGEIYMQANDDIVFKTPGWDKIVEAAFEESPSKVLLVHGSDEGQHFENFAAHGFVHKRWVDTIGYFIPPFFVSDFGDTWLNDVANKLGVRQYVPIIVEHLHFLFQKAPLDATYNERLARHADKRPDTLYYGDEMTNKRREDAEKLKALMGIAPNDLVPRWVDPPC